MNIFNDNYHVMESPLNKFRDLSSDRMPSILSYWNNDFICKFASHYFFKWFNKSNSEIIGVIKLINLLEDNYKQHFPYLKNVNQGNFQSYECEMRFFTGQQSMVIFTYYPDFKFGNLIGFYLHMQLKEQELKSNSRTTYSYHLNDKMITVGQFLKTQILNGFPSIEYIADKHLLSVSKLMRDFKNTYHTSPFIYFRKLQMEFAKEYIKETGCSKKQISLMLGFSNPGNFTNCYKRWEANRQEYTNETL